MSQAPSTAGPDAAPEHAGLFEQIRQLDNRFWIVNIMEMFERLAYYGVRAVVALYIVLPKELGGPQFTHIDKGMIFAWWAAVQSFVPVFSGGYADYFGHKRTIAAAIVLKIIGYVLMAYRMDFWGFFFGCMLLAGGTAIFKPGVQGTLAATLKKSNASVGWGIFYQLVNVGGFLGPVIAGILRLMAWKYVFLACAVIVAINFLWLPFYRDPTQDSERSEAMSDPIRVAVTTLVGLFRPRVFFFCIVFSGFWVMFNQVFDLLPNVIDDWVDSSGVIATLGAAFSTPIVPTILALVLGLVYGGVCAVGVLLAMRPDRRRAEEVPAPAYAIVAIAIWGAMITVGTTLGIGPVAYGVAAVAASFIAATAWMTRIEAKGLAIATFVVAAIGSFLAMRGGFIESSPGLVKMAAAGAQVNPEWMINLNPGLIVFTMVFFAYLSSFVRPLTSIIVGMIVATVGSYVAGTAIIGWVCLAGILVFSTGEMLSSPKKMEYLASLSPKGQEGLFMGYANIPVGIGWIAGSIYAGDVYEKTGDKVNLAKKHLTEIVGMPADAVAAIQKSEVMNTLAAKLNMTVSEAQSLLFDTYHPERIWWDIAMIGLASIIGMIVYDRVLKWYDGRKAAEA